ncbi:MAG: hypothetical protein HRU02_16975, partial [Myxococcales bacterium]|nr:hypothetical protein [Myxococcales bacterium]
MSRRTNSRPLWLFLALGVIALASLDVEIRLGENAAQAIDFFGGGEKSEQPEPFWSEESDAAPIVPKGVPATFADLAERVSPGVVNISTERTVVRGHPFEQFLPPAFGGPGR